MCALFHTFCSLETLVITVWELLGPVEHILADGEITLCFFFFPDWYLNVRMGEGGVKSNG